MTGGENLFASLTQRTLPGSPMRLRDCFATAMGLQEAKKPCSELERLRCAPGVGVVVFEGAQQRATPGTARLPALQRANTQTRRDLWWKGSDHGQRSVLRC